jgi:6-phosphogluconolactonase
MKPTILRLREFEKQAADFILDKVRSMVSGGAGTFRLGLAGGTTPASVYGKLAVLGGDVAWDRVQMTFGDERCVPPDDVDSNYRMARESFLEKVNVPEQNVHRIRGEAAPEIAAREYETMLRSMAAQRGEQRYRHDLLLLGIGPDGHTASLFPGSPALRESERDVVAAIGPKPPPQRVTMTLPLINAARHICFLVKDPAKQPVIDEIHRGDRNLPAAHVQPANGDLTWLIAS